MNTTVPIVAIGGSAGGLEAFGEFLEALPAHTGASLIIVSHLERSHESLLPEILAGKTTLPVLVVEHGVTPLPDHIYVIVPNVTVTLMNGRLHLEQRAAGRQPHMPVNALFHSLAKERGAGAVGIVLSGADSDGAAGIQAIKQAGGITFAQDLQTAAVPGMPHSAIETGCVDFVLPPARIAAELARLVAHPYLQSDVAPVPVRDERSVAGVTDEISLRRIFRRLRSTHGVDFTRYKLSTLRRRLARRMALQKIDDLGDYIAFLESDTTEAAALYQDFLIRVTAFFRDPEVFKALASGVFPELCSGRSQKETVRIWVPGCATGEEVYSLAIALVEYLGEQASSVGIQIFGTDVSESAIEKARSGSYPASIEQDVSADRLQRFFVKVNSNYCIARNIRDLCVFARQDVTRDPPFSRLDLISCRNLLIYLAPASQQRVMQTFQYALRKGGFLIFGPSESVGHASEFFELADKVHRFYRLRPATSGTGLDLQRPPVAEVSGTGAAESAGDGQALVESDSALRQADRWFLARYAPAGILVDEGLNILQFRGEIGPYLAPASGPPSLHLTRVLRPELLVEMSPALEEARGSGKIARRPGLVIAGIGAVDLEVVPLPRTGAGPVYLLVFEDESRRAASRRDRQAPSAAQLGNSGKDARIEQLERENTDLREFLQATMEQHEATKEELRSAHEEVLSANEEFQSTNEELETSKEELQSGNEELTTTNDELRDRNRQLGLLNEQFENSRHIAELARAYADGIIETIRVPLVVLDAELRILRANPAFCSKFNFRFESIDGRFLYELGEAQWNSAPLREQLGLVLGRGDPLTDMEFEFADSGRATRLFCLTARRIAGDSERAALILLSIEDITESRARTESLREGSRRKDEFLAMLAHELRNPLGPIANAVQLLKLGSPNAAPLYEMIGRQTTRLVRLVDELLDVARISRGLIELRRESLDLVAIVRDAVEAAGARLEQRGHAMTASLPREPVMICGDAVRIEQVIANLLENAIKYTHPGGQISVSLAVDEADAVLSVVDNGIGLQREALERIFELFAQVDSNLARSGGGLGLGLTVVRRVLEMHNGRIEAHSAGLGKGSEFIVRIPLLATTEPQQTSTSRAGSSNTGRPRRVLIVDDNVDSAESLGLLMDAWGHQTQIAHSAKRALEIAQQFTPETALLDIGLPDMDGYALARKLRALNSDGQLQLIAMTGYGRAEDRAAAREAGFDFHVVKPADIDRLAAILSDEKELRAS